MFADLGLLQDLHLFGLPNVDMHQRIVEIEREQIQQSNQRTIEGRWR